MQQLKEAAYREASLFLHSAYPPLSCLALLSLPCLCPSPGILLRNLPQASELIEMPRD